MSIVKEELNEITTIPLRDGHSYFQLQYFLIGKEPTVQAKLWRCIRELKTRKETLDAINLEIEDANDDLELIDIKVSEISLKEKRDEIRVRKLNRKKKQTQLRIQSLKNREISLEDECEFIIKAYRSLEKIEDLKSYDDVFSQKQYWNEKLSQDFHLRLQLGLPVDLELFKTILALNSEALVKQDALSLLQNIQKSIVDKRNEHPIITENLNEII